jgi:hypothetical protein
MYVFHEDPGHGWLEVTRQVAANVGLIAEDFSRYSYRDGDTWYLEEDCDLPTFARAFRNKTGQLPHMTVKRVESDSRIRGLPSLHSRLPAFVDWDAE